MTNVKLESTLPPGVSMESLVSTMHNHSKMIKALCPDLVEYQKKAGDERLQATYEVTDRKPVGKTTYCLILTNVAEGVNSKVIAKPITGPLTITGQWRVRHTHLTEVVHIDGNFMVKKVAKNTIEKTHLGQHKVLFDMAK